MSSIAEHVNHPYLIFLSTSLPIPLIAAGFSQPTYVSGLFGLHRSQKLFSSKPCLKLSRWIILPLITYPTSVFENSVHFGRLPPVWITAGGRVRSSISLKLRLEVLIANLTLSFETSTDQGRSD